jgi:hypothetical protein
MDQNKRNILKHFIGFCKKELNIQSLPIIKLVKDKRFVEQFRSFGEYNPNNNSIKVFITGRNLADVCRSLAHELTHHRQNELNLIYNTAGETGTEIENDANAMAGILMRDYGKLNLGVYDLDTILEPLNERKQVGNLYHFTSYTSLIQIINSGFVLTTKHKDIQPYISFTRNKSMYSDSISTQARLTIDGTKLTDKYKLSPHADEKAGYGRTSVDESEERVSLLRYPKGVDVSKSLVEVTLRKINPNIDWDDPDSFQDSEDFVEPPSLEDYNTLINLLKKKNIPFKIVDGYK